MAGHTLVLGVADAVAKPTVLPMPYASHVDMHEVGTAIVTNSSAAQAKGGIAQLRSRNPWQANVDRFGLHVQAVESHAAMRTAGAQEFVAPGSTVSADHVDLAAGIAKGRGQIVEKVEQVRIEMPHASRAVIPQKMIELVQRIRNVSITATVNNVKPLAGVGVIETQPIFGRRRAGRLCTVTQRRQQRNDDQ
jgi:hypothetical protein